MRFFIGTESDGVQGVDVGSNQNTGQWYHVVATHDGSTPTLYLDGSQVGSTSISGSYATISQNLLIGDSAAGYGNPWEGDIDDLRVYDKVLTSTEISNLYNNGSIDSGGGTTTQYFASNGMGLPVTGHNMQPQAVYDSAVEKTYAVWQGQDLHPYAAEYDHSAGSWSPPVQVGTNPLSGQSDDHGIPVIQIGNDGTLHCVFGVHSNKTDELPYATSDNPNDATSWTEQTAIQYPDLGPTYPSLFKYNGDHHILTRRKLQDGSDSADDDFTISIRRSTDDWSTWNANVDIVDFGLGNRTYPFSKAQNGSDLHLGFTWNDIGGTGSYYNLYHIIIDLTDYSVRTIDGTSLSTPIDKTTADNNALVVNTNADSEQLVTSEVHLDANNNPHFTFVRTVSGTAYHHYTKWDGSVWTTPTQITQSNSLDAYQDFFINSTTDITAYFTIVNGSRSGDIEKWHYDGSSWSLQSTVYDDANYAEGASAGQRVLNGQSDLDLVFSQIDKGDYSNSDLNVFGYRTDTDSFVGSE